MRQPIPRAYAADMKEARRRFDLARTDVELAQWAIDFGPHLLKQNGMYKSDFYGESRNHIIADAHL